MTSRDAAGVVGAPVDIAGEADGPFRSADQHPKTGTTKPRMTSARQCLKASLRSYRLASVVLLLCRRPSAAGYISSRAVRIPDPIPRALLLRARLEQLPRRPFRGRMLGHIEMHQSAPAGGVSSRSGARLLRQW